MTLTVKVHVNGNYRAIVKQFTDDPNNARVVEVLRNEEKQIPIQHGALNHFTVEEFVLTAEEIAKLPTTPPPMGAVPGAVSAPTTIPATASVSTPTPNNQTSPPATKG